jgi:ABC-type transporter Mla subunit MlaD
VIRRLLAILTVVGAVGAALVLTGADEGEGALKRYEVELDNAFGLVEGGDLKIGGVTAGEVTGFELQDKPPYRVLVGVEVTKPGFDSLRTDGRCDVRQQSLIGEYFVDCDLGRHGKEVPDGGRIPVARTSSTIPLDLVNNIMRRPYRERFRLILNELGTGLAGRPQELNEVIRRAHPALRETTETFKILADQNRVIRDLIEHQDRISVAVEPVRDDLARWAREARDTASIQASRRDELARYWNRLPEFLAELEPTMAQLERTAERQIPTLGALREAAPDLTRFLTVLGPFARETRGSLAALGSAAETGTAAITESREEIAELRELSNDAPRLGKPLRQFLQAIDDRRRSYENDPQAGLRAPPAPDPAAYNEGQGYTGMENLLNYFYWQTLAINAYDEIGHLLRAVAFTGGPCAPYTVEPTPAQIQRCNSWLGPYQPGITAPDPTRGDEPAAAARSQAARNDERRERTGEVPRTGPGGLYNQAKPGQRDLSQPQITLPPGVVELVETLSKMGAQREQPGVSGQAADEALLDYLLTR